MFVMDCVIPENTHAFPTEGFFFKTPPLWKFQFSFIHFFEFFGFTGLPPPLPRKCQFLLCGSMDAVFSGTAHCNFLTIKEEVMLQCTL